MCGWYFISQTPDPNFGPSQKHENQRAVLSRDRSEQSGLEQSRSATPSLLGLERSKSVYTDLAGESLHGVPYQGWTSRCPFLTMTLHPRAHKREQARMSAWRAGPAAQSSGQSRTVCSPPTRGSHKPLRQWGRSHAHPGPCLRSCPRHRCKNRVDPTHPPLPGCALVPDTVAKTGSVPHTVHTLSQTPSQTPS